MSNEMEETLAAPAGSAWYSKIFEYVRNRNRIGPGKVELPECDFFIVGPRRTLRVLRPTPKGSGYYESTANERPETIDENFVSRWAIRPHPSGNCRCSFRQSKNRFSTNEERIIRAEINRIRTSLCEAEKIGEDIEALEQRISLNLESPLVADSALAITQDVRSEVDEKLAEIANVGPPSGCKNDDDAAIKNKIVKDLEKYIDVLLQEVLSDTIKFFNDAGDTLKRSRDVLNNGNEADNVIRTQPRRKSFSGVNAETEVDRGKSVDDKIERRMFGDGSSSFDISFAFHGQETDETKEIGKDDGGYVNRAFSGSTTDPDSLDFDLQKPMNAEMTLDNLDCIDSGINSVETIEFQTSQEPSLEESLMEIIDAKFGRAPSKKSCEGTNKSDEIIKDDEPITGIEKTESVAKSENHDDKTEAKVEELVEPSKNDLGSMAESWIELDDTNEHASFDKLRLELLETEPSDDKKKSAVSSLREKLTWKFGCGNRGNKDIDESADRTIINDRMSSSPVELRMKNEKIRHDIRVPVNEAQDEKPADIVKFRKNKKPTIVFLHGFGSSAEIFQHQLEYFTNLGYPCVAPEMLGHGMSSAPDRSRDYHFDKLVKDLEMVLEHYAFGHGRKCVLVAHNYGCSFATALAGKYDSNIHQLVLISGGGPTPLAPPSTEGAGHCCLRAMLTPLLMCGLRRDILYSARGRQHPYCGVEPPEQWPSHMKYVLDGMVWPEGDYVFHRRICTPTLLIHGLRDNKVSLVQECQMERTIIKAFLDAIPTAGHTPMTDCPEQVNHMIHCFIDLWKRKKR